MADGDGSGRKEEDKEVDPVHRPTFVYSATLTPPPLMRHSIQTDVRDTCALPLTHYRLFRRLSSLLLLLPSYEPYLGGGGVAA